MLIAEVAVLPLQQASCIPVNPDNESIYSIQPLDDNSFLVLGNRYNDIEMRYFMQAMI